MSPLITPLRLFLTEERLFPLSETPLMPRFSAKRKKCVHKREELRQIKERTSQTKIIQGMAKQREVLGGRDNCRRQHPLPF